MEAPNYFAETLGRQHPLYVVKVSTILDESFTEIRKHELLKKEGLLVEYADDDRTRCSLQPRGPPQRAGQQPARQADAPEVVLRRAVEGSLGNRALAHGPGLQRGVRGAAPAGGRPS